MFDIVAAGCCPDKLVDVQERQVMLQLRSLAVGREGELAAAPGKRLEHAAHPSEGFDGVKVFSFVDRDMFMQNPPTTGVR